MEGTNTISLILPMTAIAKRIGYNVNLVMNGRKIIVLNGDDDRFLFDIVITKPLLNIATRNQTTSIQNYIQTFELKLQKIEDARREAERLARFNGGYNKITPELFSHITKFLDGDELRTFILVHSDKKERSALMDIYWKQQLAMMHSCHCHSNVIEHITNIFVCGYCQEHVCNLCVERDGAICKDYRTVWYPNTGFQPCEVVLCPDCAHKEYCAECEVNFRCEYDAYMHYDEPNYDCYPSD